MSKKLKLTSVIGCESCQTTTVFDGLAISVEDAFKKAEEKHHKNNLNCDETLSEGGLFRISLDGENIEGLSKSGVEIRRITKGERLLAKIFGERLL